MTGDPAEWAAGARRKPEWEVFERPAGSRGGRPPMPRPIPYDVETIADRLERRAVGPPHRRTLWPVGLAEWQYAADAASFLLALDACRLYGLVAGGPDVNVERAALILDRALKDHRIEPRPLDDLCADFMPAILAAGVDPAPGLEDLDAAGVTLEQLAAANGAAVEVLDNTTPPASS